LSWCDKLASTPTVGFRLTAHYAPFATVLSTLAPILDRSTEQEAKSTTVDNPTTLFTTGFTTSDGFKYSADEAKVAVSFNHRAKFKPTSGGLPRMEMLSKALPFTTLLPVVSSKLIEATLLLPESKSRKVRRVGIISTTPIAADDVPPGIKRLITYLGRPWKGLVDSFNVSITGTLADTDTTTDRCIHQITKPELEDVDQLMTLQFDWQRTFKDERATTEDSLKRILGDAKEQALKYFEELAEGSRFDEDLIRESVGV
jgi:hypothetical protein